MARLISTISTYGAPAKAMTLKALEERQKALEEQQAKAMADQGPIPSPWQGAAKLAQQFVTQRNLRKAEGGAAEARERLAQIRAGIDMNTGPTAEQISQIEAIDPEAGQKYFEQAMALKREQAQLAEAREYAQGIRKEDRAYQEGVTARSTAAATAAEASKDQRELGQQLESEKRAEQRAIEAEKRKAEASKLRDLTPEEIAARPGLDPKKAYQMAPDGKITPVGGDGQTINVGGELPGGLKKLGEKEGEAWSGYQQQAASAGSTMRDIATLEELSKIAPQGPITGALVQRFPGISNAGAAFQSVIKRVAPTLRAPGSGATSDIEYQGMLDSLPALSNRQEANAMIIEIMRNKAQLDIERGDIIDAIANGPSEGGITAAEGRRKLREINSRSIMPPALEALIEQEKERGKKGASGSSGGKTTPAPSSIEGMSDEELDAMIKAQGG